MALTDPKIPPRFAISDWHTSNTVIRTNAERQRDASHRVRQESRFLRNETDNHTRWTQHDSNTKLEKRIHDINSWKKSLERCLAETDAEIALLQQEKERTERALEAKKVPLDITLECLMLRENRQKIDLVRDEVEAQLHREVEVIEGAKALLQQKVSEAFEQLCLLQEARHQLHLDITDKHTTLEVDGECYRLNNNSENIGFHAHPTRTVKGSVTPETWDSFSNYNKLRAEAEMKASKHLREAIFATLQQTANDLEAQRQATEYAFRKRIHETNQAKSELDWQQQNTMQEISTLENDIRGTKEAIDAKNAPMMVAQTRLENRTYRPNVELCRDQPQYQMCHEVAEIGGSIRALNERLREAENALQALRSNLERINEDLAIKNNSLALDNRSMEVRQKMKEVPHSMINTGHVFTTTKNSSHVPTMENAPFTEAQGNGVPLRLASPSATESRSPPITGRRVTPPLVD